MLVTVSCCGDTKIGESEDINKSAEYFLSISGLIV